MVHPNCQSQDDVTEAPPTEREGGTALAYSTSRSQRFNGETIDQQPSNEA